MTDTAALAELEAAINALVQERRAAVLDRDNAERRVLALDEKFDELMRAQGVAIREMGE